MSFGGFGGFGDFGDSQEMSGAETPSRNSQRTPSRGSVSGQKKSKTRCVPTSIKAVLECSEDGGNEPSLYGLAPVQTVVLVAQTVGSFSYDQSGFIGKVTDGTGTLTVKQFAQNAGTTSAAEEIGTSPGVWVKVVGGIRPGAETYLSVTQIAKIKNLNEIAYHMVTTCAAFADLQDEFGMPSSQMSVGGFVSSQPMAPSATFASTPAKKTGGAVNARDTVLSFIQQGASLQWGFSRNDVLDKLRDVISTTAANDAIELLKEDGLIYETKDEDHFKAS